MKRDLRDPQGAYSVDGEFIGDKESPAFGQEYCMRLDKDLTGAFSLGPQTIGVLDKNAYRRARFYGINNWSGSIERDVGLSLGRIGAEFNPETRLWRLPALKCRHCGRLGKHTCSGKHT